MIRGGKEVKEGRRSEEKRRTMMAGGGVERRRTEECIVREGLIHLFKA